MNEQGVAARCAVHFEEPAEARCGSCGRAMCGVCWEYLVDDRPCCVPCVGLLRRPTPAVLYVAISLLSLGVIYAVARHFTRGSVYALEIVGGTLGVGAFTVAVSAYRIRKRAEASRASRSIVARGSRPTQAHRQTAYRGRLRGLTRQVAPPVSGAMTALLTVMLLGLVAGTLPHLVALPRWIEWQIVMAGWWTVWTASFAVLLYRGWRIADDMPDLRRGRSSDSRWKLADHVGISDPGCSDPEGCLVGLAFLLALVLALALAWVLVEMVLPAVLLAGYWLISRAIIRVANDRHDCEGHLGRALGWGAFWALLYTAPLAVVVAVGHMVLAAAR